MIHYLNLNDGPFHAIKNGYKTVEMRLNDEKRQKISQGDFLIFTNNKTFEKIYTRVVDKKVYKDFFDLYPNYKKEEIGYLPFENPNPEDMYEYYSKEKIEKYNALAIHIEVIKSNFAIVFDMDDTMLKSDKTISDYSLKVLKCLQKQGHKIVINTARSLYYNSEYFNLIQPDYAILNGGALIIDINQKTLQKSIISPEIMNNMVKDFLKVTRNFSIQTKSDFLTNDAKYKGQNAKYFDFENNLIQDEVYKIVASFYDNKNAEVLSNKYDLAYIPYFDGKFVRFNKKEVSKEFGNRSLSKLIDIPLTHFIVFGDDLGDLEMIKEAGEGVIMKNSHLTTNAKNINITEFSNDEDGVAKYLAKKFKIAAKLQ